MSKQKKLLLHPAQMEIYQDPARFKVLVAGRRFGKALNTDTPILTTEGWKAMGDIQEGDSVFDEKGEPTLVVATTPVMHGHHCYEIVFSDESKIIADAGHQWLTWTHSSRKANKRAAKPVSVPTVVTTEEIFATLKQGKRGDSNHSIPTCQPLSYPEKDLPIPPYVLGVWLGDGDSNSGSFTTADVEILDKIEGYGFQTTDWSSKYHYGILGLKKLLRNSCLLSNKHVPESYFYGSTQQRLDLLKGLMDTDGTVSKAGHATFDNTNKRLADAVYRLAVSLGIKVTRYTKKATLYGVEHKLCYRVYLGKPSLPLFKLARKLERQLFRPGKSSGNHRYILAVNPVESVPVKCIEVDSPNHLYLAGKALVPTHNSRLLLTKVIAAATNYKGLYDKASPPVVLITMPTLKAARAIHWIPLMSLMENDPRVRKIYRSDFRITFQGNKPDIVLRGANDDDGDNLRGLKLFYAGVDECQDVKLAVIDSVLMPALMDTKGSQALFIGSPKGKASAFYQLAMSAKDPANVDWSYYHKTSFDNPFLLKTEIEKARIRMPPKVFRQEFQASWESFDGQIYTELNETNLVTPLEIPQHFQEVYLGIDFGDVNPSVVVVGELDGIYYLLDFWKNPTENVAIEQHVHNEKIVELYRKYRVTQAFADPSQPGRILNLRKTQKLKVLSGYNRVAEGNGIVNTLLHQGRLRISTAIREAYDELASYHRQSKDGAVVDKVALGQNDHLCFTADTDVLTPSGWIAIQNLEVGDLVDTPLGYKQVEFKANRYAPTQLVRSGYFGQNLRCTTDHPFFVMPTQGEPGGWKPARELKSTRVTSLCGSGVLLSSTSRLTEAKVYNITVAEAHSYYVRVGENGVLVSNCDALRYVLATLEHKNISTLANIPASNEARTDDENFLPGQFSLFGRKTYE